MPKRKAQTAVPAVPKASLGARIKKDIIKNYQLYLLMIPGFLLLILFKIGPVGAMVIAFEDFSAAKGVFGSTWVGLENFKRILQDPYIWKITKNTIVLAFLSVVVVFPIPIIFSLFLNEVRTKWVRNTVQSLSFLPYFISAAVMVSIMYTLLSPTSGLINILITKLGGTSTNFMAKPEWFRPLYVILEITLMPLENVQGGDMPGDMAHISAPVCRRVEKLLPHLVTKLEEKYGTDIPAKLVIAVSGGSGSGKTSGAAALREALAMVGLKGYVLSGDNYPRRIPQHNDEERLTIFRSAGLKALLAAGEYTPERFADLQPLQKTGIDSDPRQCAAYPWMQIYQQGGRAALAGYLGRTAEQDYDALNAVLAQFRAGAPVLWLKRMGRKEWERWYEPKNFADVDVLLLEWTHAGSADLKNTNLKVFFNSTPEETRACRVARSRDAGADSPFVTMVLEIEQAMLNRRACDADLIQNRDGTMVDTAAYAAAQGR